MAEQMLRQHTKIPPPHPLRLESLRIVHPDGKYPLASMIALAIWTSPERRLMVSEIRSKIETALPELSAHDASEKWKNSIRFTLSEKNMFVRLHRSVNYGGRGGFWTVDPAQHGGRKSSGQSSTPPGSPITDDSMYELALTLGVSPAMLNSPPPPLGGEPHVHRPGANRRPTPYAPY
ncbi:hypothetical protein D9619_012078 [Psilocybe cf. subviscida]|uniref:Fork-head domain-containing protein n=1 Tax=Psilocybe cf. subviscida TaxID=2480587 RepID=A0A8H5B8Q7_9AGAR|nr:hypothetical protein D9619_012078 [Psilocybe cf. subviscida]